MLSLSHLSKTYETWKKEPGFFGTLRSIVHRKKITVSAVRDVSFTMDEGAFVGLIGPNGAGKTTVLKMLSGILWPTSGGARVLGFEPWKREREFQKQIAIVLGSKNQLWWDLPARETFLLNKEIYTLTETHFKKRLATLGDALAVTHLFDTPVRKLSLGERMKCELVNALLHNPRVLFLDEPTIGLDVISQKVIRDFLREWNRREGATVILTSHAMEDVKALCERVLIMDHGTLAYDGSLATLVTRVADSKEVKMTFTKAVQKKDLESLGVISSFETMNANIEVPRDEIAGVAKHLLETFPIADLAIQEMPIEEVIRRIFSQQKI